MPLLVLLPGQWWCFWYQKIASFQTDKFSRLQVFNLWQIHFFFFFRRAQPAENRNLWRISHLLLQRFADCTNLAPQKYFKSDIFHPKIMFFLMGGGNDERWNWWMKVKALCDGEGSFNTVYNQRCTTVKLDWFYIHIYNMYIYIQYNCQYMQYIYILEVYGPHGS